MLQASQQVSRAAGHQARETTSPPLALAEHAAHLHRRSGASGAGLVAATTDATLRRKGKGLLRWLFRSRSEPTKDIKTLHTSAAQDPCVKRKLRCHAMCDGVVEPQQCDADTKNWSCRCNVENAAEPRLRCIRRKKLCSETCNGTVDERVCDEPGKWACACGTEETAAQNTAKPGTCKTRKAECRKMCLGAVDPTTCDTKTGEWSCQCPGLKPCDERTKECVKLCKGVVESQSCSATTGSWTCRCGKGAA